MVESKAWNWEMVPKDDKYWNTQIVPKILNQMNKI